MPEPVDSMVWDKEPVNCSPWDLAVAHPLWPLVVVLGEIAQRLHVSSIDGRPDPCLVGDDADRSEDQI